MSAAAADKDPFTFFHELRVRWSELDPQGIVFNPNYFVYFDVAFTEYMRAIGLPYPSAFTAFGTDTFAVATSANFRSSAVLDDVLSIGVRVTELGRTSMTIGFSVRRGTEILTEGSTTYVNANAETRKPEALPVRLVEAINRFERVSPAAKAPR